ncbi:M48 family metallopeptidase [Synoicihabitans lomoniglobus]|uniref:M48 family metallopeptidase n=1 Tax=Synoicihabitans lomoniglobus TaxID=2909285 RepID=A0AAF0CQV5_9BACT|nr:M48 family metallopeptidase [Opitutaceae bacterium LMO-M01]WED66410.1 M48 family metallopeptidase [Opitutaceae bacterium LMO-M01]
MVLQIALVLIVARLGAELILAGLNRREVSRHAQTAPAAVAAIMDDATYRKSVDYTLAKAQFNNLCMIFDAAVLALVLASGVLPMLFAEVAAWAPGANWDDALFVLLAGVLLSIPGMPFEWWGQFRIEERFGFNKSTAKLWLSDKAKGLLLMFVIGFPLLWGLLGLVGWVGSLWWIWAFVLLFGFQLIMMVLYPKLILPLFNKLTPLPDGDLRDRLMALGERTGFKASTIEVIDGSKRSGHSNAYFTGFGRFRRIVLFDTLIEQLAPEELEAVLAHEVGHYKRGHIPKMLITGAAMQLGSFAALAWLLHSDWFLRGFGFPGGELAPALLLFGLLSGVVTFWISPLNNLMSRKHEYEADAFARDAMGSATPLIGALRKLAAKNLSNLTPHPWFSGFYYSHPTIVEREHAMTAKS